MAHDSKLRHSHAEFIEDGRPLQLVDAEPEEDDGILRLVDNEGSLSWR